MKYIFVMNPHSGKKKNKKRFLSSLDEAARKLGIAYEIYYTKSSKDGERHIGELCRKAHKSDEKLRIYCCGGDGTVHEAVNGSFGFENVEIGAVPLGTGNDFIRNFGTAEGFLDMERQLKGKSIECDLIKYKGHDCHGDCAQGLCVNMFNIGFDCNVVDMTDKIKRLPLIGGSLAYLLSVFIILIKKKGADLTVRYPDGSEDGGKILLLAIANGCYCGGGIKGVPYSVTDDGLMDVSMVRNVTRRFFIRLFGSYAKGTHLENPDIKGMDIIRYSKEDTLNIKANDEMMKVCIDGEISTYNRLELSVKEKAFKFIVP